MTIELSKTQTEALQSGAAHDAGNITLPATLRGGARQKVLASLIVGKLAAYRSGTLVITATGMAALGKADSPSDQLAEDGPNEDAVVEQPDSLDSAVGTVAAEEPDTAAKIPHPITLTWISRPGSQLSHGDSPRNMFSDNRVRNRISPIQINKGSAASDHDAPLLQVVVASTGPIGAVLTSSMAAKPQIIRLMPIQSPLASSTASSTTRMPAT